jgi:membrane protein
MLKTPGRLVWQTLDEFLADRCPQMAAAISFYMIFSLPPLLVLLILLLQPVLDPETVTRMVESEARGMLGTAGAEQVRSLVENVSRPGQGGPLVAVLGIAAFLFGATAAFAQLQAALNAAWQVGPDPQRGDVLNFLLKRALSFAMIGAIGLVLILFLVLSALVTAFGETLEWMFPGWPSTPFLRLADAGISFMIVTLLFTAMFRYLPDARVAARAAFFGGAVTALLFTAGKLGIGFYLGQSDPASAFGAAGSLAMVLIWIYYSAMIVLLGAEFTQIWMRHRGDPIEPEPGAVRLHRKAERYEPEGLIPEGGLG